jgi:hypothetical protein
MDQSHAVRFEVSKYLVLKERLFANFPTADEGTLLDTLEGITDLHEMIAAVIRSALVDQALQTGLQSRLEEMRQRLARLEDRGTKKRQLALEAMNGVGLKKLEQPDFTASARAGFPALVIVAETGFPTPIGYRSRPSSTGRRSSARSSAALRFPVHNLATPNPCSW